MHLRISVLLHLQGRMVIRTSMQKLKKGIHWSLAVDWLLLFALSLRTYFSLAYQITFQIHLTFNISDWNDSSVSLSGTIGHRRFAGNYNFIRDVRLLNLVYSTIKALYSSVCLNSYISFHNDDRNFHCF